MKNSRVTELHHLFWNFRTVAGVSCKAQPRDGTFVIALEIGIVALRSCSMKNSRVTELLAKYGHTSTVSIRVVRAVTLLPSLGGFLITWPIAITLMPVARILSTSGASLTTGSCPMTYLGREVAELHTRSSLLMRGYWADRYFLRERVFDTPVAPTQRRVPYAPPRHMCLLEGLTQEDLEVECRGFSANDFLSAGDFPAYFASRMQARLPEILEYTQERKTHKTAAHYRAEAASEAGAAAAPAGSAGVVLGDVPFPPDMEGVRGPGLGLGSGIVIRADRRQAPPPVQLDLEHTTHRYQEICQQFGFARSYIGRLYSDVHERDLDIGRLRRHQSRQSSAVSRLQAEVEWLRTGLELPEKPPKRKTRECAGHYAQRLRPPESGGSRRRAQRPRPPK
ncbi:hypothetical protein JCGZ_22082 [Jatropha curcas]|uniref:Aminotransferase-like plant mobile domain-containing protein n=1 Tax=Jatropha curcas TaxID=180498 RepID=A0A067JW58_JATCU|nr:hypothetical protein JCGZ_22082 [Jatropha curcas]